MLSVAGVGDIVADGLELDRLEGNIAERAAWIWETARPEPSSSTSPARGCAGAELKGREVEVNIAGSGDVEVRAQERLKVGIAGSGSVSYWGDPCCRARSPAPAR